MMVSSKKFILHLGYVLFVLFIYFHPWAATAAEFGISYNMALDLVT